LCFKLYRECAIDLGIVKVHGHHRRRDAPEPAWCQNLVQFGSLIRPGRDQPGGLRALRDGHAQRRDAAGAPRRRACQQRLVRERKFQHSSSERKFQHSSSHPFSMLPRRFIAKLRAQRRAASTREPPHLVGAAMGRRVKRARKTGGLRSSPRAERRLLRNRIDPVDGATNAPAPTTHPTIRVIIATARNDFISTKNEAQPSTNPRTYESAKKYFFF
jgi:hypothetical protein